MPNGDHGSRDDVAYFAAALRSTRKLLVTAAGVQFSNAEGPLPPGRYLLHISDVAPSTEKVWVRTAAFVKGMALAALADVPAFPFQYGVVVALELNVHARVNDQIVARMSAGTATLYVSHISNDS